MDGNAPASGRQSSKDPAEKYATVYLPAAFSLANAAAEVSNPSTSWTASGRSVGTAPWSCQ
ncbi:hypothetical protein REH70_16865 [Cellulomonas sp. ATA003]|nr:hypothetical protein [Cellulomonas sp. ATA003]WNB85282.1 hypothetical protein REH70_16865 [Cellulomonas sp. ATA003]